MNSEVQPMLASAFQLARSSLSNASDQIGLVSRNLARASDEQSTRKITSVVTQLNSTRTGPIRRVTDDALMNAMLSATSSASRQQTTTDILDQLSAIHGEVADERSPFAMIGQLSDVIQFYAANPASEQSARSAIGTARDLSNSLNAASQTIADLRVRVESDLADGIANANELLAKIDVVNQQIVTGSQRGLDVTDQLDQRDGFVKSLAEEIGLRVSYRNNSDIVIQADSGIMLFETVARKISYQTSALSTGVAGNTVQIDGMKAIGPQSAMTVSAGRLKALVDLRDKTCIAAAAQIDEISRGLIAAFAETSTDLGSVKAGLFMVNGNSDIPQDGVLQNGLGFRISVNPSYDPEQGGNAFLLRDSGSAGASFISNTSGFGGYTDRIDHLAGALEINRSFSPDASLGATSGLPGFAAAAIAWLSEARQTATNNLDYQVAVQARASDALQIETGISLDVEMSHMLELERSYQASAKLISSINQMYDIFIASLD